MPKRILQGVAVKDARDKTVIVRVERRVMHPVYKKFIMRSKKYAAHDELNQVKGGETVRIEESRPISKRKRWVVLAGNATAAAAAPAPAETAPARKPVKPRAPRKRAAAEVGAEG
ncbi:MAG TPA: 30S ribosomal protein S17 [Stellaceae bacterium]|nr:30S ribosomal protein S17 [Stellaceae bacterium]